MNWIKPEDLIWKTVNDAGIESPLAKVTDVSGFTAKVEAYGDGSIQAALHDQKWNRYREGYLPAGIPGTGAWRSQSESVWVYCRRYVYPMRKVMWEMAMNMVSPQPEMVERW